MITILNKTSVRDNMLALFPELGGAQRTEMTVRALREAHPDVSDKVLALMEEYVKEKGLPVDEVKGTRFPIMSFYMWAAAKYPIYGVVANDLQFIDVGKLDALKPAEEFVRAER